MKTKEELTEIIEDVIQRSEHKHLIEDLASEVEALTKDAYNEGFSDAQVLPF